MHNGQSSSWAAFLNRARSEEASVELVAESLSNSKTFHHLLVHSTTLWDGGDMKIIKQKARKQQPRPLSGVVPGRVDCRFSRLTQSL